MYIFIAKRERAWLASSPLGLRRAACSRGAAELLLRAAGGSERGGKVWVVATRGQREESRGDVLARVMGPLDISAVYLMGRKAYLAGGRYQDMSLTAMTAKMDEMVRNIFLIKFLQIIKYVTFHA
jgi:hypothetical protein